MKMNRHLLIAILLIGLLAIPATAQVRFGIRGGITVGELRFDRDVIDSDNRVGYTAGLLLDFNIPAIGVGIEASAMYTHRDNRLSDDYGIFKRHYFDVPVYARYRLDLPSIRHIVAPYVYTGPCFAFLFNENAPDNYDNAKTHLSWDVGAGAELFRHLRLSATYGLGITRAMEYIHQDYKGNKVQGMDKYWTLNAAWLF